MYKNNTVGVVMPAYNEEGYVGEAIETLPEYVDRAYVIDDGSSDGTWDEITTHASAANEISPEAPAFDKRVRPHRHERNQGVGGAIKTGYQLALADGVDVVAVMGGDAQMDPRELPHYLDPIVEGDADYTKGNRFMRAEDWEEMPRFRLVGNLLLTYLTKIASGYWTLDDSQNGYTAISQEALGAIDLDGMYEYYGYCNDLLVRLNAEGMRVADVQRSSTFAYQDGWKSHIKYSEYVPRVSTMLLRGFFRRLKRKYLLGEFHPLVACYLLGSGVIVTSILGLVGSLVRDRSAGAWLRWLFAGVVLFLAGAVLEREECKTLEERIINRDDETEVDRTTTIAAND